MQRNRPDQSAGLRPLLALALLCYPAVGGLYPLLPPFLGVVYLKWRDAIEGEKYPLALYWMLYLLIFEAVWGLPLYGLWLVMVVTFRLIEPRAQHFLYGRLAADFATVALFDGGYLAFLLFYQSVTDQLYVTFHPILLYYLLLDLAGVMLF